MPFGYDLQQVFMMVMQKTMWDCKFNSNNLGGFGGGSYLNSCWGNGFMMQGNWGDYCQLNNTSHLASSTTPVQSTPSTPTQSVEEKVEADMARDKFTSLRKAVLGYVNSLGTTKNDRIIKETFKRIGSTYSAENLSKLQEFYKEHKTDILKNMNSETSLDFLDSDKEKISTLETMELQTKLTDAQISDLKKLDGVSKFLEDNNIKDFWVDTRTNRETLYIRIINKDGNLKTLDGISVTKNKDGSLKFSRTKNKDLKLGISVNIENMRAQKAMIDDVLAAKDVLKEASIKLKRDNSEYRIFEEKKTTGGRKYKRVFFVDNEGKLKELKNTYITIDSKDKKQKLFWNNGQKEWEYDDADLDSIKSAAS